MYIKKTFASFSCCCVFGFSALSASAGDVQWSLNENTGQLNLTIEDSQPLEEVLTALSTEMGFELELGQLHYANVTGDYSGTAQQVISRLVQPASVFVSGSDVPPFKINRVTLLPVGDEQSEHLPTGRSGNPMLSSGVYTGPKHNKEKFERRLREGH